MEALTAQPADDHYVHGGGNLRYISVQRYALIVIQVLKKDGEDDDDPGLLVVGAESGHVFILPLDPSGSAFMCRLQLPSVPVILNCSGLFDTEWR